MDNQLKIRFTANTPETRERGLMFADPLKDDEVVLFAFPHTDRYAFWNKNVSFGLSLAFLNDTGKIVDFADLEANSTKRVAPRSSDVKFVVEAALGSLERRGLKVGDMLEYSGNDRLNIQKIGWRR